MKAVNSIQIENLVLTERVLAYGFFGGCFYKRYVLSFELQDVPDYTTNLLPIDDLGSKPLAGVRFGIITETVGDGVHEDVLSTVRQAAAHLESLGASVREVPLKEFSISDV